MYIINAGRGFKPISIFIFFILFLRWGHSSNLHLTCPFKEFKMTMRMISNDFWNQNCFTHFHFWGNPNIFFLKIFFQTVLEGAILNTFWGDWSWMKDNWILHMHTAPILKILPFGGPQIMKKLPKSDSKIAGIASVIK